MQLKYTVEAFTCLSNTAIQMKEILQLSSCTRGKNCSRREDKAHDQIIIPLYAPYTHRNPSTFFFLRSSLRSVVLNRVE